jgi:hypothetical protein
VFIDQNPCVNQGAVVENKRLGEVLSTIQVAQAKRDGARLASKGLTKREKAHISAARAAADVAPVPPPEPVTEDRLGAVFSFLEGFEAQQKARRKANNDKAALRRRKASGGPLTPVAARRRVTTRRSSVQEDERRRDDPVEYEDEHAVLGAPVLVASPRESRRPGASDATRLGRHTCRPASYRRDPSATPARRRDRRAKAGPLLRMPSATARHLCAAPSPL